MGSVRVVVDAPLPTLFVGIVQGLVMQSMMTGKPAAMRAQADPLFAIYLRGICEAP